MFHSLTTSIPLWWTNNKCLKIALAKCQCYHSHGIRQKTNVCMCVTLCKTHFKRWIWSVIFLLPRSLSSGLHMMLNWKAVSSGLLQASPGSWSTQALLQVLMVWTSVSLLVPDTQSSVSWVGQGLPSAQPCERRGAAMSVCTAGLFPSWDLAQVTHPQLQVESPGPPSGSVAFFAAKGEQFSQCQCRWLKNQLSCPWFGHVIIYSSLMKFCNSCAGM